MSSVFLNKSDYSWPKALLWGYFNGHCKKAVQTHGKERALHLLLAGAELFPIISQIVSSIEKKAFESSLKNHSVLPAESPVSYEQFKIDAVGRLALTPSKKPYKRSTLHPVDDAHANQPITFNSLPNGIKHYAPSAIYYGYNSEGIRDFSWGVRLARLANLLKPF